MGNISNIEQYLFFNMSFSILIFKPCFTVKFTEVQQPALLLDKQAVGKVTRYQVCYY